MKYTVYIIAALLICCLFIGSVSAVPVIIGFKDSSQVRTASQNGIMVIAATGNSVTYGTSVSPVVSIESTTHIYPDIHAAAADLSDKEIAALKASGTVRYIEPDYLVTAYGPTMPWNIKQINADTVQAYNTTGQGVKVAVIDTGIDYTHPDLAGAYAGGFNVLSQSSDPLDDNGHGTHCAGILAAVGSSKGIYGTAPGISLYGVKVLSDKGEGHVSDVIEGIFWAKNNSMQVASMSLGLSEDSRALHDAIDEASTSGVLIVAAAGNSGVPSGAGDTLSYPAKYDGVLSVAAVNKYNHRASWSSTGRHISISAPGVNIRSTIPGSTYATYSGTSMAAPHVAGVAALVYSAHPDWTNEQVRDQIVSTATPLGNSWFYGAGLVNATAAVNISTQISVSDSGIGEVITDDQGTDEDSLPFSWGHGIAEAAA
ncbi:MAG: S8 family peptidase [Methanoregula sp.]